ncbi:MAG: hypothetical protein IT303_16330 [Dehalococcoidia bacterium]|nr:hypothetical protein [Dehalococcoidia bacterium]
MKKALLALPALALATVGVLGLGSNGTADAQGSGVTVLAGDGETGYSVNQFLPANVTVAEGTTVTWEFPWYEPHIVAFLEGEPPAGPPPISEDAVWPNDEGIVFSGDIFGDPATPPTFDVTFPEAGTYQYFCPIHPQMVATVTVVASGDTDTQAEIDARADAEYATNIALVKALATAQGAKGGTITPRADGTNLFEVIVGGVDENGNDAMLFFPTTANIETGDTVRWVADAFSPHTVTFNAPPGPPSGDPFAIPQFAGDTYPGGTDLVHSGILTTVPGEYGESDYATFELTFDAAGTFNYVCILHAPQGMVGSVTVAQATTPTATPTATATATATATPTSTPTLTPTATATATATASATATATQTTAPRPPSTGSGTEDGNTMALVLVLGAAGAFLAAGGAFGAATLRRR